MKVWISGGSGFVGSHLLRAFDDVCAPSHAEVDVTHADAVRRSIRSFGLDRDLLDFGPPLKPPFLIPYDTSLAARATAAALGVELPSLANQLARLELTFEEVRA